MKRFAQSLALELGNSLLLVFVEVNEKPWRYNVSTLAIETDKKWSTYQI